MICAFIKKVAVLITIKVVKIEIVIRTRFIIAVQMIVIKLKVDCDCLNFVNLMIKSNSAVYLLVSKFKLMSVKLEKSTKSNCECLSTCFSNSNRDVKY